MRSGNSRCVFDDLMKTLTFPAWQVEAMAARMRSNKEPALFADALMPAVSDVPPGQGRLEQRIALLRHVEALRLYASGHKGALPASLSEIPVPLPDDPFTGKPFRYEVIGNTAHLRGTPPRGRGKRPDVQGPLRDHLPEMRESVESTTRLLPVHLSPGAFRNDSRPPCRRVTGRGPPEFPGRRGGGPFHRAADAGPEACASGISSCRNRRS